jgi:hypothetical protein
LCTRPSWSGIAKSGALSPIFSCIALSIMNYKWVNDKRNR